MYIVSVLLQVFLFTLCGQYVHNLSCWESVVSLIMGWGWAIATESKGYTRAGEMLEGSCALIVGELQNSRGSRSARKQAAPKQHRGGRLSRLMEEAAGKANEGAARIINL